MCHKSTTLYRAKGAAKQLFHHLGLRALPLLLPVPHNWRITWMKFTALAVASRVVARAMSAAKRQVLPAIAGQLKTKVPKTASCQVQE